MKTGVSSDKGVCIGSPHARKETRGCIDGGAEGGEGVWVEGGWGRKEEEEVEEVEVEEEVEAHWREVAADRISVSIFHTKIQ